MRLQIFNLILRGLTLASKFLLVFALAKFLRPVDVGVYGLMVVTIGYCAFILGGEFYTFSMRELVVADQSARRGMLRSQIGFHLVCYAIFMPLFIGLFVWKKLPWAYVGWFYAILLVEHFSQEVNRILVSLSMQLHASAVLFVRSGAWCLTVIGAMVATDSARDLNFVLGAWLCGSFLACILGAYWVGSRHGWPGIGQVDWRWVRKGAKTAAILFVAALALQGLTTFDRYAVQDFGSVSDVGAYSLFAGIATAMISFLEAGVIVFFYPSLIDAAKRNDLAAFAQRMRKLTLNVVVCMLVLAIGAWCVGLLVVQWLDKPAYSDNFYLFKYILLAMFVFGVSHIPHLGLYARGLDRVLLWSQIAAMLAFAAVAVPAGQVWGVVAVPVALCFAYTTLLLWKTVCYRLMLREFKNNPHC
ncbi:hypothetical protein PAQ31011_04624 [Pandoraea aquatica]|uniref:Polysaccharide biosynthesis protein n=1 Tax=Pandoraea aquatica TaxID=2508290 RepID=A0A5E4YLA2_9BURK|nr:hypothetical protein [Pandoraea aquatica]VVE49626.1 hypothetical protein PAQ31011_04624 [Pandoraea aquatica]